MKPNFFIVGGPKCGTTALSTYLGEHPHIYMSSPKEPDFFCTDFPDKSHARNLQEYISLFDKAKPTHVAVGEASVWYLYSKNAAAEIQQFCPNARIIIMLRNPVEIVYSLHSQLLWTLDEDIQEFKNAWLLQEARKAGKHIPAHCVEPAFLQYRKVAMLGEQTQRYFDHFDSKQIHIIFFDDFKKSPSSCYLNVLKFLSLPNDNRLHFPVINDNKGHRNLIFARFTQRPPAIMLRAMQVFKKISGIEKIGLLERIRTLNNQKYTRKPLEAEFCKTLSKQFTNDIQLLENITGRDLATWKM